ncbi:YaaC family protein [Streptomyces spiralis]
MAQAHRIAVDVLNVLARHHEVPLAAVELPGGGDFRSRAARGYAGGRYFLPVLPLKKRELHPLMAWWALLYTLSMLARYEPSTSVKLISIDDSQHAVPIERLLERALNHLPVLIADTITEVST